MPALSNYLLKELSQLHCIDHRLPPRVHINEEGFVSYATCCEELQKSLSEAQDTLREQFQLLSEEEKKQYLIVK